MKSLGMLARSSLPVVLAAVFSFERIAGGTSYGQDTKKAERAPLEMSKAVVCKKVEGYEKFTTLPDSALTSEDKLVVYYRPLNLKVVTVEKGKPGHRYRAKLSQDSRIRRKGEKTVLMKKDLVLEYEPFFETASERFYLVNNMSLKGLTPGDYEYDIILHDALDEASNSTQTVSFTIIPTPKVDPPPKTEGPDEPEGSPGPKAESKGGKKPAKSP